MKEFTKSEAIALAAHDHYYSILHLHGDRYGVWDAKGDSLVEYDDRVVPAITSYRSADDHPRSGHYDDCECHMCHCRRLAY